MKPIKYLQMLSIGLGIRFSESINSKLLSGEEDDLYVMETDITPELLYLTLYGNGSKTLTNDILFFEVCKRLDEANLMEYLYNVRGIRKNYSCSGCNSCNS